MEWINPKEKLPEYMQICIIEDTMGQVFEAQFSGDDIPKFSTGDRWHIAVFWMPMPLPHKAIVKSDIMTDWFRSGSSVYKRTSDHETTLIASCFNEEVAKMLVGEK